MSSSRSGVRGGLFVEVPDRLDDLGAGVRVSFELLEELAEVAGALGREALGDDRVADLGRGLEAEQQLVPGALADLDEEAVQLRPARERVELGLRWHGDGLRSRGRRRRRIDPRRPLYATVRPASVMLPARGHRSPWVGPLTWGTPTGT